MTRNDRHSTAIVQVTAPNGGVWTRQPGGRSTGPQLLQALTDLSKTRDLACQWNWWQEDRRAQERDRAWQIILEWDNGAPGSECTEEEVEALVQAKLDKIEKRLEEDKAGRADLVAQSYDKEREYQRLQLLRTEADAAFFAHVVQAPASQAQRENAERRVAKLQTTADELRSQLGDPEQVLDRHGYLPAERRETNLQWHMDSWRHPTLREWAKTDKRLFNALLSMPMPEPAAMCAECQAPAEWHEYDLSLQLFRSEPPSGSTAEKLAPLFDGWWERCPACTAYQIEHQWGGQQALPDFGYDQWRAMLPPLLRTLFTPAEPKQPSKRKQTTKQKPLAVVKPGPIADVMAKLAELQAEYPDAQVRQGDGGRWELWRP